MEPSLRSNLLISLQFPVLGAYRRLLVPGICCFTPIPATGLVATEGQIQVQRHEATAASRDLRLSRTARKQSCEAQNLRQGTGGRSLWPQFQESKPIAPSHQESIDKSSEKCLQQETRAIRNTDGERRERDREKERKRESEREREIERREDTNG